MSNVSKRGYINCVFCYSAVKHLHWLTLIFDLLLTLSVLSTAVLYLYDLHSAHWYLVVICFAGLRKAVANDGEMTVKDEQSPTAPVCSSYLVQCH